MIRVMSVIVFVVCAIAAKGCGRTTEPLTTEPLPTCLDVKGNFDPGAPGFIVSYQSGVDPIATTKQLETKYGFAAIHVYTALPGFSAQLTSAALVGVSCERSVASISHDGVARLATP
jgi:hypothetical protein